jgi:hypothetical protein
MFFSAYYAFVRDTVKSFFALMSIPITATHSLFVPAFIRIRNFFRNIWFLSVRAFSKKSRAVAEK